MDIADKVRLVRLGIFHEDDINESHDELTWCVGGRGQVEARIYYEQLIWHCVCKVERSAIKKYSRIYNINYYKTTEWKSIYDSIIECARHHNLKNQRGTEGAPLPGSIEPVWDENWEIAIGMGGKGDAPYFSGRYSVETYIDLQMLMNVTYKNRGYAINICNTIGKIMNDALIKFNKKSILDVYELDIKDLVCTIGGVGEGAGTGKECIVCMDDEKTDTFVKFDCGHEFHCSCIKIWIEKNILSFLACPLCKKDITLRDTREIVK